jgi:hypothetical protein
MSRSMSKPGSLESARYLRNQWFTAWVLTTNSWWEDPITWWIKKDWSFFMIDSLGDYYESKDPKELRAQYLALKWILDWKGFIKDADGNLIWTIKTDLEKLFEGNTSSIWTWNSLSYAGRLATNGIQIAKWHDTNIDIDSTKSTKIDYTFGNWDIEWWIFYHENKNIDSANLTSIWLFWARKTWSREGTFWEFSFWAKVSQNTIEWQNWNKGESNGLSLNSGYSKWFSNKTTDFWVWAVVQGQIIQDIKNGQTDDSALSFWISLDMKQQISRALKWNINVSYSWDFLTKDIRTSRIDVWWEYRINNLYTISWKINYEKSLWYNKTWFELGLKSWDTTFSARHEETNNWGNTFLLNKAKNSIWLEHNLSNVLSLYLSSETTDNRFSENTNTSIWGKVHF